MQAKILNNISNNKNQQMNELKFNLETIKLRVDNINKTMEENDRETRTCLKELD